jgi:hypothetical protein
VDLSSNMWQCTRFKPSSFDSLLKCNQWMKVIHNTKDEFLNENINLLKFAL